MTAYRGQNPTKKGVYLVKFIDGSAGVALWDGYSWDWGDLTKNTQLPLISSYTYLGLSATQINTTQYEAGISSLPPAVQQDLIGALDSGQVGIKGNPVYYTAAGKPVGSSGKTFGDAQGGSLAQTVTGGAADLASSVADALTSPLDFLKFIAWLFHPVNILRLVEFNTGMATMFIGLFILLRKPVQRASSPVKTIVRAIK